MGEKKYFVLYGGRKRHKPSICKPTTTWSCFKVATRGHTDIRLRERGTKRVHVFTGRIDIVDKPANGLSVASTRSRRLT